jgi:hypothetical protein
MPSQPQRPGEGPRLLLLEAAKALAEGKQKPTSRHRFVYQISGGPPGKRLERTLEVSGSGTVTLRSKDELLDNEMHRAEMKVPRKQIENLFRELVDSRLFENVDTGGGFAPDSTIGIIRFDDGTREFSYYFLADEHERQQQRKDLNPSLQRMTSILEAMVQELSGGGEERQDQ